MTTLSLVLPQIGQPDTTEDVKLINGFTAIQSVINGNLDSTNLSAATSQSAGVNASGQTAKGATIIATSQNTSSAAFTTLATPDQVTGVVLPASGLITIWYQATWQESVSAAASAAIFLGANQLQNAGSSAVGVQTVGIGGTANLAVPLSTYSLGLASSSTGSGYPGDVTTGQTIGDASTTLTHTGGPCYVFAAAGTYTVSVQFKTSSGTVTAANRRLYVQAISFA